jgi:hypothetical protein
MRLAAFEDTFNPRTWREERKARLKRIADAAVPDPWNPDQYPQPKTVRKPPPHEPVERKPLRILSIDELDAYDLTIIPRRFPKIAKIQHVVGSFYNIPRTDLLSRRRAANVVFPRQIAMYLCKTLTLNSLPEIGRKFGGKDHTTILHAVRKITKLLADESQSDLRATVAMLTDILKPETTTRQAA